MSANASQGGIGQPLSDFPSPNEFARRLLTFREELSQLTSGPPTEYRAFVDALSNTWSAPISTEGLERLIVYAFYASLRPEEGRFPRFRLHVLARAPFFPPRVVVNFSPPIPLEGPDTLRRLAPAVSSHDRSLVVREREGGGFDCVGIEAENDRETLEFIGDDGSTVRGGFQGLAIRVNGPADLRVAGWPPWIWELRGGSIRWLRTFVQHRPVQGWLEELGAAILRRRSQPGGPEVVLPPRGPVPPIIHHLWSEVLLTPAHQGHGGAFAILPDQSALSDIAQLKGTEGVGLGDQIVGFLESVSRVQKSEALQEFRGEAMQWVRAKRDLFATARIVGQLAAVDGCVVLDRDLSLFGFGGKIGVADQQLKETQRAFVDYETKDPRNEDAFLKNVGTRHGSAFRLCKAHGGVIVFVLSQDGELRVFSSDDKYMYVEGPLSPESHPSTVW